MQRGRVRDKKLCAFRMITRRCHADATGAVIVQVRQFRANGVIQAAVTVTARAAALYDKIRDDTVKVFPVKETLFGQFGKIRDAAGRTIAVQFEGDVAFFGSDNGFPFFR